MNFDVARLVPDAPLRLVIFNEHTDATYYAYFHFLLHGLAEEGQLSFFVVSRRLIERDWQRPAQLVTALVERVRPNLVIFNRYALPYGEELLTLFRTNGIPVLYHIDDDLLSVPAELGSSVTAQHGDPQVMQARRRLLTAADAVQPSTECLATAIRQRLETVNLIAPFPPPYLGKLVQARGSIDHQVIGYMASKSHAADFEMILPALTRILELRPHARFETFGTLAMPDVVHKRFGRRVRSHPPAKSYEGFLQLLARLGWTVGVAPLIANRFNECKSGIKFLEYTACAIPMVASSGPAYAMIVDGRNGLVARSPDAWVEAVVCLLDDVNLRNSLVQQAREDCESAYSFDKSRMRLLQTLAGLANRDGRVALQTTAAPAFRA